jgi:hypothetical protein
MADYMNNTPKHVVSTTLDTLEWANSSLVNGDAAEGISRRLGTSVVSLTHGPADA